MRPPKGKIRCGLMQESKDIQQNGGIFEPEAVVV